GKNLTRKRLHLSTQLVPILRQAAARSAPFAVKRYRKHREQAGMACSSINREVATLSHLLGFAAAGEQKWIKARPHKLPPIKEGADRSIALTSDQMPSWPPPWPIASRTSPLRRLRLSAAMRHSGILAARFDKIDFNKLRLHTPRPKQASGCSP